MKNDFRCSLVMKRDVTYVPHKNWRSDTLSYNILGECGIVSLLKRTSDLIYLGSIYDIMWYCERVQEDL